MRSLLLLTLLFTASASCVEVKHRAIPEQGSSCETSEECPAAASICDVSGSGTCVECLPERADACGGTKPVCGEDSTCQACAAHADCASDACLPDGACALEEQVVYLKQGGGAGTPGNGNSKCSRDAPCGTMAAALLQVTAARPYVRVEGTIENVAANLVGKTVTLLGSPGAALKGLASNDNLSLLDLKTGSKVEIYDLTLQDSARYGVRVADVSTLRLHRSKVINAKQDGVFLDTGGIAEISESEISDCGTTFLFGISVNSGSLTVTRSKISANGGGISVDEGQRFIISNSFIVGNKSFGGLHAKKPAAGSKLELSTIADNRTIATAAGYAAGIYCDDASFTFSSNIVFRNTGGAGGFLNNAGACKLTGSLVSSNSQAESGLLGFLSNVAPFDYHLTAASPATVIDAAGACTGVDYDGEPRGEDGACDLGADEYRP